MASILFAIGKIYETQFKYNYMRNHIFSSLFQRLCCKISFLVICEILALFVNTLTVDDKYSLHNSENLAQTIQIQLCNKRKNAPFLLIF